MRHSVLDHLVVEPEDRGHRAGLLARRLGHREAALAHELDRLLERHRVGGRERCELADRVADDVVGLDAARAQRREHGEAGRDERRLLDLGLDQLLDRRLEAEPAQVEAGRLAPALEDLHRLGHGLGDVAAHAASSEPCPGKQNAILLMPRHLLRSIPSTPSPT